MHLIQEEPQDTMPRLRHLRECLKLLKQDFPELAISRKQLYLIVNSAKVRKYQHGNRWIVSYDDLIDCLHTYTK